MIRKPGTFAIASNPSTKKQHYEGFCRFLRDEQHVSGGDRACVRCDVEQARNSLIEFQRTGDPFRSFECHMGLTDITYVIQVRNSLVAIAFLVSTVHPRKPASAKSLLGGSQRPHVHK